MEAKLITINQLMQRWGVSRATIYNMFSCGQLRPIKIRGATRVSVRQVNEIENHRRQGAAA